MKTVNVFQCPHCLGKDSEESDFCPCCGKKIRWGLPAIDMTIGIEEENKRICSECNKDVNKNDKFCGYCGKKTKTKTIRRKVRYVAYKGCK